MIALYPTMPDSSTSEHSLHSIKTALTRTALDTSTRQSFQNRIPPFFLAILSRLTKNPNAFKRSYRGFCIPDNQTGSWPWGPWRSCRAEPHTHGCSGGKPHGGLQSWTPGCPGCCCPRWGSPPPSAPTRGGSTLGQVAEGVEGAGPAFPILGMKGKTEAEGSASLAFWKL